MRVINTVGSSLFVAYGAVLWAQGNNGWSLVVCNTLLVGFNVYHIIRLALSLKKQKAEAQTATDAEQPTTAQEHENAQDNALLSKVKELASNCETLDELRAALNDINA